MANKKGSKLAKYQARVRATAKEAAQKQQHSIIAVALAFGLGYAKAEGFKLPTVVGIHPAALYGVAALVAAFFIKDKQVKRIAEASADGLLSVAAYVAGREGFKEAFGGYVGAEWGGEIVEEEW